MSSFDDFLKDALQSLDSELGKYNSEVFLEASMAACALIAAADGSVEEAEVKQTQQFLLDHPALKGFDPGLALSLFNDYVESIRRDGSMGRIRAVSAVRKTTADAEQASGLIKVCVAIGKADGNFDESEKAVVRRLCEELKLDPSHFGL